MAGIEVDLDALLEGCASTSGAPAVAFVHGAGGTCDGIAKRVSGPRAEAEAAVRGAARTGTSEKGCFASAFERCENVNALRRGEL